MSVWFRVILWHFVRCGSATDELDGESRWPAVKLSVTALLTSVLRHRRRPQQLQQQPPHHHSRYRSAHTLPYPVRSGSFNFGHILRVQISSYLTRLCIKQNCFPVDNIETFKILNGNYSVDKDLLFAANDGGRRGQPRKLFKRRCRLVIRKFVLELLITGTVFQMTVLHYVK